MKRRLFSRLFLLLLICGMAFYLCLSGSGQAQISQEPFSFSTCNALAVCCGVTIPSNQGNAILYGLHVSNTSSSPVFVQLYNAAATPAAAATPIGASSWTVAASSSVDVSVGEVQGWAFNKGIEACCSTTQGTFTAATAVCGFLLEYR